MYVLRGSQEVGGRVGMVEVGVEGEEIVIGVLVMVGTVGGVVFVEIGTSEDCCGVCI